MSTLGKFGMAILLGYSVCGISSANEPDKPKEAGSTQIDYEKDVLPILSAHCFRCHGEDRQRAGLALNFREAILTGGNSGPAVVVGKAQKSRLIEAVKGVDPDTKMPPGEKSLTDSQIAVLADWIDQGLQAPSGPRQQQQVRSDHWAFQPIKPQAPPKISAELDTGHPIDQFVRYRLQSAGLEPSERADKTTLLRRLSLDLTGLPPEPAEVERFLNDSKPGSYERAVDRLLASPHYGERWARHWLDAARYADSDGYEKDSPRPFAWRYRDWVINALNNDMPFDQFTIEQLAGDLIPDSTTEQQIATGFHRNTLTNKEGGVDQEEFRVAAVVDRVNTTATVWLGLTVACAQCHDHKYDPISHREYYQLFAYFNSDREQDILAPLPGEENAVDELSAELKAEREKLVQAVEEAMANNATTSVIFSKERALANFDNKHLQVTKAQTLTLGSSRPTHVMIRGDFLRPGVKVEPGTLAVLPTASDGGTRLELAQWLVSQENPLTARVITNWAWAKFFGRGLVATPEDFGTQGEAPSHPELLDFLAEQFRNPEKLNWSLKKLHRLIVTSETYKQSSAVRPELLEQDPMNILLARQSRLRLESEILRDAALTASGLLTREVGGPSVRPPQPKGISELTYAGSAKWVESQGPDRYKRGLYIWFQRTSPYPSLMTFDNPDSNVCVVRRERSNTPLQALTLLNDQVFVEASRALAERAVKAEATVGKRIDLMLLACLGRKPSPQERQILTNLFQECLEVAREQPEAELNRLLNGSPFGSLTMPESAAMMAVARTVMNLDEFITRE